MGIFKVAKEIKNRPSSSLEHWMDLRFKLFLEGILIGIVAGFLVVLYRVMLDKASYLREILLHMIKGSDWWAYVLMFVALICIAYLLGMIVKYEPNVGGSGIPQVKGQLAGQMHVNWAKVILGKFVGGILAIGTGLSLGREGPSVQLGAAIGQGIGKTLRRIRVENKYLITSGASAGLAAAFNAPLAGVIFALEEMHKNFSPIVLLSAMAASLTADFVSRYTLGEALLFTYQDLPTLPLSYYVYLIILGAIIGLFGVLFNKCLIKSLDFFKKSRIPVQFQPAIPLLFAGILGFTLPETLGGGHHLVNSLSVKHMALSYLLLLVIVKFIFTMISYGSGVPGGIFLPLLVIGALTGNIFGDIAHGLFQIDPQYINNFIVLSMAAYFTAIVKAPITGSILVTEMTGSFSHLLAMATISMIAYIVTDFFNSSPIYDELLERTLANKEKREYHCNLQNNVILEIAVCMGSLLDQKKIRDIQWPKDCLLVSIQRGETEVIPTGNTKITAGDFLIVLTKENKEAIAIEHLTELAGEQTTIVSHSQ